MKTISLLLGAGFSKPKGYPVGSELNDLLIKSHPETFRFSTGGSLIITLDGKIPDTGYKNSYDYRYDFCVKLMMYFRDTSGYFDYEEFYDFVTQNAENDENVLKMAEPFLAGESLHQLLDGVKNVYVQVVAYYLKDKFGKAYYDDNKSFGLNHLEGYFGVLNYLEKMGENYIVNVHTLNHDLLFESFASSSFIANNLSDGFEELGSPFYGELLIEGRVYNVRLPRFTGRYNKKFRLYKLHGSRDYVIWYKKSGHFSTPDERVKTLCGVGVAEFKKEIKTDSGESCYDRCWLNFYPDFLTGTTSKIDRYNDPVFYSKIFDMFKKNLKDADKFLVIGYGGKDTEINRIILDNFDYKRKKSLIVDPYPSKELLELKEQIGAKLISQNVESLKMEDLH